MQYKTIFLFIGLSLMLLGITGQVVKAQDVPSIPPSMMDSSSSSNSLAELLKADLMKRLMQTKDEAEKNRRPRVQRPHPEWGNKPRGDQPIDITKYIGPEGDANKTYEKLAEKGLVPPSMPAPSVPEATDFIDELTDDMPLEIRFGFIGDLVKRRKYDTALRETEKILESELKKEDQLKALILREKALFHDHHYDVVENDYFRLKAFFPKEEEIDELKSYIEKETGIAPLKKAVLENPGDAVKQHQLLSLYKKYGWMDLAEEFFLDTIQDISPPTIISLSEIYFLKKDYAMLIELSRKAQELYPEKGEFVYNEGVGLYSKGEPLSKEQALEVFKKVRFMNLPPATRRNVTWYLKRLNSASRRY